MDSDRHAVRGRKVAVVIALAATLFADLSCAGFGTGRRIAFHNLHTEEKIRVTYARGGAYVDGSLARINRTLRDHRSGEVHRIDPRLLDLLYDLQRRLGSRGPYQVISAYRAPNTNARLRAAGRGVAEGSLHMQGMAIDVRLKGVASETLRDEALRLRRGGVGYYPSDDFVHLDVGRPRSW